jgi:DnaK suppressor protein
MRFGRTERVCERAGLGGARLTSREITPILPGPPGGRARDRCRGQKRTMTKTQLKKFKESLEAKRNEIIQRARQTLDEDMTLDVDDLPDEMDLASSEYLQSFTFRLRGRERMLLDKIQKALARLEEGSFGDCEECGDKISVKRLEARPETTLCIRCKEEQERVEKDFG